MLFLSNLLCAPCLSLVRFTHTHTQIYIYAYIYVCVCVCVYVCMCVWDLVWWLLTYCHQSLLTVSTLSLYIRGAFNQFPDIFVQAFKIVVDSWKFTMLLLYIVWDKWPIFMISASNEQLQQHLEYILLKPDYHSWWISKMQSDTLEERYTRKFCFKIEKNATETYGMLQTGFGASCMNRATVFEWHKRFK